MTPPQLTLTARLNTSAVDSRRGVVRLHPNAIAALGIREWDAVSLTGSRTTTAVAGMAGSQTPVGAVLLDDVTLSNAGLSEDTAVIVAAATVYGARSVTLSGSALTAQSVPPPTLRQALLGKVVTVGDAVSLLPRDLGPGTSTSAAAGALASAVGISWTSELLTVTGVDPTGPVSVQPNSLVTWGTGVPAGEAGPHIEAPAPAEVSDTTPPVTVDDLRGVSAQAAKLTEWLKLALDETHLLQTLGAATNLGVLVSGPAGVGKSTLVRAVCVGRRLVELDGPEVGALIADDRLKRVASAAAAVCDGGGVLLIADIDALLPATAEPVATLILAELRKAVAAARVDTPSFVKMLLTWRATVFSLIPSFVAMARLVLPVATSTSTWVSRPVRRPVERDAGLRKMPSRRATSGPAPNCLNVRRAASTSTSAASPSPMSRHAMASKTRTRAAS